MTKRTPARSLVAIIGTVLTLGSMSSLISGCGSGGGKATGDSGTTRLVASWHLVRATGGMTGKGYPVTPDHETLTFHADGTFTRTILGETTTGTYQVIKRPNSFGDGTLPIITYNTTTTPDVVTRLDADNLTLNDEAADGFNRDYERVSP